MSGYYRVALLMSGSGRETLPDVRETLPDVREWSGGLPGCPGVVKRPSRISESGREAILDVRVLSGGPSDVREW